MRYVVGGEQPRFESRSVAFSESSCGIVWAQALAYGLLMTFSSPEAGAAGSTAKFELTMRGRESSPLCNCRAGTWALTAGSPGRQLGLRLSRWIRDVGVIR